MQLKHVPYLQKEKAEIIVKSIKLGINAYLLVEKHFHTFDYRTLKHIAVALNSEHASCASKNSFIWNQKIKQEVKKFCDTTTENNDTSSLDTTNADYIGKF